MINELFGNGIISFLLGVIMGIIDEWNKKVMFFIIMFLTVLLVIGAFIIGPSNIYSVTNPWWMTLYGTFFIFLGMMIGKVVYRSVFE